MNTNFDLTTADVVAALFTFTLPKQHINALQNSASMNNLIWVVY